jgi:hypothetical protein
MPGDSRKGEARERNNRLRQPSVTVTFDYGGELHTLVAPGRAAAFDKARIAWGDSWDGEPVVSSPASILRDLSGITKERHGQDFWQDTRHAENRDRFRRTGQSYDTRNG